jgi:hypothetical protein
MDLVCLLTTLVAALVTRLVNMIGENEEEDWVETNPSHETNENKVHETKKVVRVIRTVLRHLRNILLSFTRKQKS